MLPCIHQPLSLQAEHVIFYLFNCIWDAAISFLSNLQNQLHCVNCYVKQDVIVTVVEARLRAVKKFSLFHIYRTSHVWFVCKKTGKDLKNILFITSIVVGGVYLQCPCWGWSVLFLFIISSLTWFGHFQTVFETNMISKIGEITLHFGNQTDWRNRSINIILWSYFLDKSRCYNVIPQFSKYQNITEFYRYDGHSFNSNCFAE